MVTNRLRLRSVTRVLAWTCCAILLASENSWTKLAAPRNPFDGVLDAELVVIVRGAGPGAFAVQEVFLGGSSIGDMIALPDFKLYTPQKYGPDIVEATTERTRILMFLRRSDAQIWELIGFKDCFFWVQDPRQIFQLEDLAKRAVDARQRWQNAAQIADARERVAALWEFVFRQKYGRIFFEHTMEELRKAGAPAGDYIAEKFDSTPWNDRSPFYNEAGTYGSEALHQKLISHLQESQRGYEAFVLTSGWAPKDALSHWNEYPELAKDLYGEIYYGLAGIASFKDPRDLPLIREVALWAVDFHLEQPCEAALDAFRSMPSGDNVPIVAAIQGEFPRLH